MVREEEPLIHAGHDSSMDPRNAPWYARSRKLLRPLLLIIFMVFIVAIVKWPMKPRTVLPDPGLWTGLADRSELADKSADPCDDFYQHACGSFLKQPLPKDRDTWLFSFDGVRGRVAAELEHLLTLDKGQAGQMYASCLDEDAIEKAGDAPLKPYLDDAVSIASNASLVHSVAKLCLINAKPFFLWNVGADADSSNQVMYMQQGGLTLPDKTYYTLPSMAPQRKAMLEFVTKVLTLIGESEEAAKKSAASVMQVESELAEMHLTRAQERAVNSLPSLEVGKIVKGMAVPGGFDWGLLFDLLGVPKSGKVVRVIDVDFFSKLCNFLASRSPESLRDYIRWKYLDSLVGHLGKDLQAADLVFRRALFGVHADPPRKRLCMHTLNLFVPDTLGALYLSHSPGGQSRRGLVEWMLKRLRQRFERVIEGSAWISESARETAMSKLGGMLFEVGGPRHTHPLPFKTKGAGWFDNSVHIAQQVAKHQISKIGTVLPRRDWGTELGSTTVNAFYNIHSNALFVPAALLQYPFFEGGSEDMGLGTADWGQLGGLLGHEMSHGFDNVGRLFGPDLVIKSWWDKKTTARYNEKAKCVGRHYASYTSGGGHVDGNSTLEEDIADMAGLRLAHDAMLTSGGSGSGDSRRFFRAWAQTWCSVSTGKELGYALRGDPHAPSQVRVNAALSSFPAFSQAYNCPVGSNMRPSKHPCTVW